MRNEILTTQEKILNYRPFDENEKESLEILKKFLDSDAGHFSNESIGHVTGSAIVTNHECTKILLIYHKATNRWFQPGGHSDGNPNTYDVALREFREELNYSGSVNTPLNNEIFDIDVHTIKEDKKRGLDEHLHYDIRFLFSLSEEEISSFQENEISGFQWVDLEMLNKITDDHSLLRCAEKLRKLQIPNT